MTFKIVQITERKRTYFTTVPSAWERQGTLYWPNTTNLFIIQKLIQNARSIPERYWFSQSCILKKTNIITIEDAEDEIDKLEELDDAKNLIQNRHKDHTTLNQLHTQETNATTMNLASKLFPNRDKSPQKYLKETDIAPVFENISKNLNQILKKQSKILMELEKQNTFNGIVTDRLDQLNNTLNQTNNMELEKLNSFSSVVKDEPDQLINSLSINHTRNCHNNMSNESSIQNDSNASVGLLDEPISSQEELDLLELNLNDSKQMESLISKMKKICGEKGFSDANNCCYNLVDRFFTRSFLLNVSWSGGSRSEHSKLALRKYTNVLCVFNTLVILASKEFDEQKSKEFFKTILRNAKRRYESEIDHLPKIPEEKTARNASAFSTHNLLNTPIANQEELEELEIQLEDDKTTEYLIAKMKRVCGGSGIANATNCCYSLVDRFFTRSFLMHVSWSGGSRTGSSKLPLKTYRRTLGVFNRLVKLASKDFDEYKSKEFFITVLRNCKKRYISEIDDHIPRKSTKKVRKKNSEKEDIHSHNGNENSLNNGDDGVVDDIKLEAEFVLENKSY